MPIKTLGSLGKIRVGRVTGNTHIFFFGLAMLYDKVYLREIIRALASRSMHRKESTVKFLNFGMPKIFAVIYLKFKNEAKP